MSSMMLVCNELGSVALGKSDYKEALKSPVVQNFADQKRDFELLALMEQVSHFS